MENLTNIFNLEKRKTFSEAIILFFVSVGGAVGISYLLVSVLETLFGVGYVFGFWFGIITAYSVSIFLSLRILIQRKLGFINKLLLLIGLVLTGFYGVLFGLIPFFIVTLSYDNNEKDDHIKEEPNSKEKATVVKEKPIEVNSVSSMKEKNISELAINLTQLNELKEKGILTDEEFTEQKKNLLK
jgi:hypothetical protein